MKTINVILSGGVGSRLWPLSRKTRPKQYLPLLDGKSLFQLSVERNLPFCNELLVVGGIDNYQLSREILSKSEVKQYTEIVEACPRNTAAAIAFAAFQAGSKDILLVTPSDHLIKDGHLYAEAIEAAVSLAEKGNIVTFGLQPKSPETGFGYIEYNGNVVISFREKPSRELAETFVNSGRFLWNSGMFCFQAGVFLGELEKYEPEVFIASRSVFENKNDIYLDENLSLKIPSISVDYAVMERTDRIKVIPSFFDWSDMGSFLAMYDSIMDSDPRKSGSNLALNSDKLVEFVGVENIILVETDDVILVLNKDNAQDVKRVYERLEKENPGYLK